jgi:hypothetical protein
MEPLSISLSRRVAGRKFAPLIRIPVIEQKIKPRMDFRHGDVLRVEGIHDRPDINLRLLVYLVIVVRLNAVPSGLTVLTHHDHGCGIGGLKGEHQVHENERIRVPVLHPGCHVQEGPNAKQYGLADYETPGADLGSYPIRRLLAEAKLFTYHLIDVFHRRVVVSLRRWEFWLCNDALLYLNMVNPDVPGTI